MSILYFNNGFNCGVCSGGFIKDAKDEFCKGYKFKGFSWSDGKIDIEKDDSSDPLDVKDIEVINSWFESESQYPNARVYRNLDDLRKSQEKLQREQWRDLCVSMLGFLIISILNLLSIYLKSMLLQQLLGVLCGLVCTVIVIYLGYDIVPRLLANSWYTVKRCMSEPTKVTLVSSSLYEYLLVLIVTAILVQALVTMGYGLFIGHMLCMHHFHCPLMIATSFYAKRWLRTKISGDTLSFDDSCDNGLKEPGKVYKGQRILFNGKLASNSAVFDASYSNGDPKTEIVIGDKVKYGWIYLGTKEIQVQEIEDESVDKKGAKESLADKAGKTAHGKINKAEKARNEKRTKLFNKNNWGSSLQLICLLAIAVVAPIIWYVFAASFSMAAGFDMAFSIILIACPCRDFVKNFCYYLACAYLPKSIHLKGEGVYELLDDMVGDSLSKIKIVFDWTNTLQRDKCKDHKKWDINKLRSEVPRVLEALHKYASSIGVYSGTDKIQDSKIKELQHGLNIKQFLVKQTADEKAININSKDKRGLYIGDNHNDILAGLASKVFVAIHNKDAVHDMYNPIRYADIVLDDTLEPLPELFKAIEIAKKTSYIVGVINTIYNICALFLACGGYFYLFGAFLNPVAASFIMLGSMLLNLLASIAFAALFTKLAYSSLTSLCEIGDDLGLLGEKQVVESVMGYVHKDRTHTEISDLARIAAGRYPCGYRLFAICGYVVTTRGVLELQEYTARCRLCAISIKWQEKVSGHKDQVAVSGDFCTKYVTSFISYVRSYTSTSSYNKIIHN